MSTQDSLFHEDLNDALRHAVKAMGGFEVVGHDLWPNRNRKAAGILLSDCLNPERSNKLDLPDLVALLRMARLSGVHCAMEQLCNEAGYKTPEIAAGRTPQQELAERMDRTVAEYKRLADEHAALLRSDALADVRALRREGR